MRCPFCAEEIQEAARLCRFCGATRAGAQWIPPERPGLGVGPAKPKKDSTLRFAAVFFLASAGYELFQMGSDVVVLGAVRAGATAAAWHVFQAGIMAVAGVGLLSLRRWGYLAFLAVVALYSADQLLFLLDRTSVDAWVALKMGGMGAGGLEGVDELKGVVDPGDIARMVRLTAGAMLACWWGLAGYVFLRRDQFKANAGPTA